MKMKSNLLCKSLSVGRKKGKKKGACVGAEKQEQI